MGAEVMFPLRRRFTVRSNMRLSITIVLVSLFVCSGFTQTSRSRKSKAGGGSFVPGCQMPFKSKKTAFDSKCSMNGSSDDADKIAESRAKNNFCAAAKYPVRVSSDDFLALQKASDDLSTRKFVDRSPLHWLTIIGGNKVGEGTIVEFVAY